MFRAFVRPIYTRTYAYADVCFETAKLYAVDPYQVIIPARIIITNHLSDTDTAFLNGEKNAAIYTDFFKILFLSFFRVILKGIKNNLDRDLKNLY